MSAPWAGEVWFHWIVAHSGGPWIVRRTLQRTRATILVYHDPEPETIEAHLAFLQSRYTIVPLHDIVAWLRRESDSIPPRALAITLDDGWAGNYRLEGVFRAHGVVPTLFVCTQIIGTSRRFWWRAVPPAVAPELKRLDDRARLERLAEVGFREEDETDDRPSALTANEVQAMQEWADVQSHTRFHPVLPRCDESRAWCEIRGSLEDLRGRVDTEVDALAYPNGDWTPREVEMARLAGYRCAVTIDEGLVRAGDSPYTLRRVGVTDAASLNELAARASCIHVAVRDVLRFLRLLPRVR